MQKKEKISPSRAPEFCCDDVSGVPVPPVAVVVGGFFFIGTVICLHAISKIT